MRVVWSFRETPAGVLVEIVHDLKFRNRILAPFAKRVCLAFPPSARPSRAAARASGRYRVTGRPMYPPTHERAGARARFGIADGETCVLVFGGSLGARSINQAAIQAFAGAPFHVLHICGRRDFGELAGARRAPGYDLREYLDLSGGTLYYVTRELGSLQEQVLAEGRDVPAIDAPFARRQETQ